MLPGVGPRPGPIPGTGRGTGRHGCCGVGPPGRASGTEREPPTGGSPGAPGTPDAGRAGAGRLVNGLLPGPRGTLRGAPGRPGTPGRGAPGRAGRVAGAGRSSWGGRRRGSRCAAAEPAGSGRLRPEALPAPGAGPPGSPGPPAWAAAARPWQPPSPARPSWPVPQARRLRPAGDVAQRLFQFAYDRRFDGRRCGLHELAKILELREDSLAVDAKLLGQLVDAGLSCHGAPFSRPAAARATCYYGMGELIAECSSSVHQTNPLPNGGCNSLHILLRYRTAARDDLRGGLAPDPPRGCS